MSLQLIKILIMSEKIKKLKDDFNNKSLVAFIFNKIKRNSNLSEEEEEKIFLNKCKLVCYCTESNGIIFGNTLIIHTPMIFGVINNIKQKIFFDNEIYDSSLIIMDVSLHEGTDVNKVSLLMSNDQENVKIIYYKNRAKNNNEFLGRFLLRTETSYGYKIHPRELENLKVYNNVSASDIINLLAYSYLPSDSKLMHKTKEIYYDQNDIDKILEKISLEGLNSLSNTEKFILNLYSQKLNENDKNNR